MNEPIVESAQSLTLLGGGAVSSADLEEVLAKAPRLVAADGGARHAVAAGHMPEAVIGDFDSLPAQTRAAIPAARLHHIAEQSSTDFEKCLSRIRAPLVVGLGFMGPRTDHQLAAFHGLLRCAAQPCILVGETQLVFLCPPRLRLEAEAGALVSLFPLVRVTARSTGLQWGLEGVDLAPDRQIGTSNAAVGGAIDLSVSAPGLLVILPRSQLDEAMSALARADARWSVPAG